MVFPVLFLIAIGEYLSKKNQSIDIHFFDHVDVAHATELWRAKKMKENVGHNDWKEIAPEMWRNGKKKWNEADKENE